MLKFRYVVLPMLVAASSVARGDYYAGLQLGAAFSKFDAKIQGAVGGDAGSSSQSLKASGFSSRLLVGGLHDLGRCSLWGWDAFLGPKDNEAKKNNVRTVDGDGDEIVGANSRLKMARDYTVGTSARWGYYMTDSWAATVNLGLLYSQFKTTLTDNENVVPTVSHKRRSFGIAPGVGLLMHHKNFLCRFDYAYEMYQSFKTKDLSSANTTVARVKAAPRYHSLLVTFGYKF